MHVAIITLFMMMNTKGQEEDNGSSYPFVPGKNITQIYVNFTLNFLNNFRNLYTWLNCS